MLYSEKIIMMSIKNIEEMYRDKEKQIPIPIELKNKMYEVIYKGYEILSEMISKEQYGKIKKNSK